MKKKPKNIVEMVRKQVLSEFQRIEGEDYEEWTEFIQEEINLRLEELRKQDLLFNSIRYDWFDFFKKMSIIGLFSVVRIPPENKKAPFAIFVFSVPNLFLGRFYFPLSFPWFNKRKVSPHKWVYFFYGNIHKPGLNCFFCLSLHL